jgi:hypothetical protein
MISALFDDESGQLAEHRQKAGGVIALTVAA